MSVYMKTARRFYIYTLMDPRLPGPYAYGPHLFEYKPFYIGKGTGWRLRVHLTDARRHIKNGTVDTLTAADDAKLLRIIEIFNAGLEPITHKLVENLTEFESFEHETVMIGTVGREIYKMGPLVNENDGTQFLGPQPVKSAPLTGMNNVVMDDVPNASPRVVLNADITPLGQARRRSGRQLRIPLPGAHSLFACPLCMLVAAHGVLYRLSNGSKQAVGTFDGPGDARLSYTEANGKIYISNEFWNGVYSVGDQTLTPWGVEVPNAPLVFPSNGSLSPGRYMVCLATMDGHLYGGAGPWAEITLTETGGIAVLGRQEHELVFCTDPDGAMFFRVGAQDTITSLSSADPLISLRCNRPLRMKHIQFAFGRMWGAVGNRLYYSEPHRVDLFHNNNYIEYDKPILMVAPVSLGGPGDGGVGGIYVGFDTRTIYLTGANPEAMVEREVGLGVAEYALAYCNGVPQLGDNVPVWTAQDGIVAGSASGSLQNLTRERVQFSPGSEGASMFTMSRGYPQFLTNFRRGTPGGTSAGVGFGDSATCEVIRNGTVIKEEK